MCSYSSDGRATTDTLRLVKKHTYFHWYQTPNFFRLQVGVEDLPYAAHDITENIVVSQYFSEKVEPCELLHRKVTPEKQLSFL